MWVLVVKSLTIKLRSIDPQRYSLVKGTWGGGGADGPRDVPRKRKVEEDTECEPLASTGAHICPCVHACTHTYTAP